MQTHVVSKANTLLDFIIFIFTKEVQIKKMMAVNYNNLLSLNNTIYYVHWYDFAVEFDILLLKWPFKCTKYCKCHVS